MGVRDRSAIGALLGVAVLVAASSARADEDDPEVVPLPVIRAGLGAISTNSTPDSGLLAEVDVGVHLHYAHLLFGGELGYVGADGGKPTTTHFFQLGAPLGLVTDEATFGAAFVPRLLIGQRDKHDVTAIRIGAAAYVLGGAFSLEIGHERWLGDGGGAHFVAVVGLDAGRVIFLLSEGEDLEKIR